MKEIKGAKQDLREMTFEFKFSKLKTAIQNIPRAIEENPNEIYDKSTFKAHMNKNDSLKDLEQQWKNAVSIIQDFFKSKKELLVNTFIISKISDLKDVSWLLWYIFLYYLILNLSRIWNQPKISSIY
jgi:hypothetical protein